MALLDVLGRAAGEFARIQEERDLRDFMLTRQTEEKLKILKTQEDWEAEKDFQRAEGTSAALRRLGVSERTQFTAREDLSPEANKALRVLVESGGGIEAFRQLEQEGAFSTEELSRMSESVMDFLSLERESLEHQKARALDIMEELSQRTDLNRQYQTAKIAELTDRVRQIDVKKAALKDEELEYHKTALDRMKDLAELRKTEALTDLTISQIKQTEEQTRQLQELTQYIGPQAAENLQKTINENEKTSMEINRMREILAAEERTFEERKKLMMEATDDPNFRNAIETATNEAELQQFLKTQEDIIQQKSNQVDLSIRTAALNEANFRLQQAIAAHEDFERSIPELMDMLRQAGFSEKELSLLERQRTYKGFQKALQATTIEDQRELSKLNIEASREKINQIRLQNQQIETQLSDHTNIDSVRGGLLNFARYLEVEPDLINAINKATTLTQLKFLYDNLKSRGNHDINMRKFDAQLAAQTGGGMVDYDKLNKFRTNLRKEIEKHPDGPTRRNLQNIYNSTNMVYTKEQLESLEREKDIYIANENARVRTLDTNYNQFQLEEDKFSDKLKTFESKVGLENTVADEIKAVDIMKRDIDIISRSFKTKTKEALAGLYDIKRNKEEVDIIMRQQGINQHTKEVYKQYNLIVDRFILNLESKYYSTNLFNNPTSSVMKGGIEFTGTEGTAADKSGKYYEEGDYYKQKGKGIIGYEPVDYSDPTKGLSEDQLPAWRKQGQSRFGE